MNLLEMYKELTEKEREEFISLVVDEINKMTTKNIVVKVIN